MAELEEKKKKLEALRQQQANKQPPRDDAAMKEEADRLNKQLRIQQKAKFVTKRNVPAVPVPNNNNSTLEIIPTANASIDTAPTNEEPSVQSETKEESTVNTVDTGRHNTNSVPTIPVLSQAQLQKQKLQQELEEEREKFRAEILLIVSIDTLRERLNALSQEKRALRLEQRQRMSAPSSEGSHNDISRQLQFLDMRYSVVEERIRVLTVEQQEAQASSQKGVSAKNSPRDTASHHGRIFLVNRHLHPLHCRGDSVPRQSNFIDNNRRHL